MESTVRQAHPVARSNGLAGVAKRGVNALEFLAPVFDLAVRLWVANVFFKSGLTKIASFDTTVALFENEYNVPLLSPYLAALLGTGAELFLPILLALGSAGRFAAAALFVLNIVAVSSYPDLSEAGFEQHFYWGFLMLVTVFHGPGKLSVDHFIRRAYSGREQR